MRLFFLMFASLGLAVLGSMSLAKVCFTIMGVNGAIVALPLAIVLGVYSGRIVEKVFGYTLKDTFKD